jgi:hypothetical protein
VVCFPLQWASGLASVDWPGAIGGPVSSIWYLWLLALGVLIAIRRIGDPVVA